MHSWFRSKLLQPLCVYFSYLLMHLFGSIWRNSNHLNMADSLLSPMKGALMRYLNFLPLPLYELTLFYVISSFAFTLL